MQVMDPRRYRYASLPGAPLRVQPGRFGYDSFKARPFNLIPSVTTVLYNSTSARSSYGTTGMLALQTIITIQDAPLSFGHMAHQLYREYS